MKTLSKTNRERIMKLSTTNVADALDALGIKGATYGINAIWPTMDKVVGAAVTIKLVAAGLTKSKTHLGVKAIDLAQPGDVILVDNGGRLDTSCWGGILANGAKTKGISGVVIDGACRDVDDYVEIDFPVYARGSVVSTARGRIMEQSTNEMVQFGGIQVRPGDIVVGDKSGIVIIPQEKLEDVLAKAEDLWQKEEDMVSEIRSGKTMAQVDEKFSYEKMLK